MKYPSFLILTLFSAVLCLGKNDYYQTLRVKQNATTQEITASYRKLVFKFHPDVNKGDAKKAEQFKALEEAYMVLGDPNKRTLYDQSKLGSALSDASDSDFSSPRETRSGTRVSEGVMNTLVANASLNEDSLANLGFNELRNLLPVTKGMNGRQILKTLNEVNDIFTRVGEWEDYNGGQMRVTQAALEAGFLFLESVRNLYPEEYERYRRMAYEYFNNRNYTSTVDRPIDREYADRMHQVLRLAEKLYRERVNVTDPNWRFNRNDLHGSTSLALKSNQGTNSPEKACAVIKNIRK